LIFFEQGKMNYINIVIAVSSAQGVPKMPLKRVQVDQRIHKVDWPMHKHDKGLAHHKCSPKTNTVFLLSAPMTNET